ncbi:MAG: Hint domain-containing protein, partial [Paracoccaceae bacterium]
MPLSKLDAKTRYTLIGVNSEKAPEKFARTACVFFARGTRITLSIGMLKPIEELNAGDEILTRDAGVQEIRWIGQVTMRASGAFAPVLMKAGALNNVNDLVLGPEHRLFIYQRSDELGTGRSETLVRVRHLVNGNDVIRIEAGY